MPPDHLINALIAEIKRTEETDAHFLVGYLSSMLATAADKSLTVKTWIEDYHKHLQTLPDAK
jgi:hypothetical protein